MVKHASRPQCEYVFGIAARARGAGHCGRPVPVTPAAVFLTAAFAMTLEGCGGDDAGCPVAEQNTWIQQTMQEWYLEPDQLPELDPAGFETPSLFLQALTLDVDLDPSPAGVKLDRFSRVTGRRAYERSLSNTFSGFGLLVRAEVSSRGAVFRILDVYGTFPGEATSPASEAGLVRGDIIETFDGNSVEQEFLLFERIGLTVVFGFDAGTSHTLGIRKLDGREQEVRLVAENLMPASVPLFQVLPAGDDDVGYIFFRDFDFTSVEGLRRAVAYLAERGVTKLIVDQRYNLGGWSFIVDYLANLLIGDDLADGSNLIRTDMYNAAKADEFDNSVFFSRPSCPTVVADPDSDFGQYDCQGPVTGLTGLTEAVFINSGHTASASEAIINSLLPYIDVTVVGTRSRGKPVGSAPFPPFATGEDAFCGLVLRPITFRTVNANDESDYFNGFDPDCPAEDDATSAIGDPAEASLTTALRFIERRSCALPSLRGPPPPTRPAVNLDAEHIWSYANSLARLRDEGRL